MHRYGRAVVFAAALWGLGIALFGYSSSLWLVLLGLAIGGGADAISGIFRSTMWNESIPPDMRGRMAGHRDDLVLARSDRRSVPRRRDGGVDDVCASR